MHHPTFTISGVPRYHGHVSSVPGSTHASPTRSATFLPTVHPSDHLRLSAGAAGGQGGLPAVHLPGGFGWVGMGIYLPGGVVWVGMYLPGEVLWVGEYLPGGVVWVAVHLPGGRKLVVHLPSELGLVVHLPSGLGLVVHLPSGLDLVVYLPSGIVCIGVQCVIFLGLCVSL